MNQEDRFRKFVEVNKQAFEEDFDTSGIWQQISDRYPQDKKFISFGWMIKAAALALLLISAFAIGRMTLDQDHLVADNSESIEYNEMNSFYAKQVDQLIVQANNADVDKDVIQDIMAMDLQLKELMMEYENADNDEKGLILSAIINNYQTRIGILNHVLIKLNYDKNESPLRNQKIKI